MTVVVEIWERDNLTTPGPPTYVETITEGWGRGFRNVKNDVGSATINIQLSDTAAILAAQPGRLLKFIRDGVARGGGVIGTRRFDTVERNGRAEHVLVLECAGFLALLNDAPIKQYGGAGWHPWDTTRAWDYSNPYLDTSGWVAATELWRQGEAPDLSASSPVEIVRDQGRLAVNPPETYMDGDSWWVWSSPQDGAGGTGGSGTLRSDPGVSYFEGLLTLADPTYVKDLGAADDYLELAIDGVQIIKTGPDPEEAWSRARFKDLLLSAGDHVIRAKVENFTRAFSNGNIAAFINAIHVFDPTTGTVGAVLHRTDDNCTALDYPATPPGFTAGAILLFLLAELQAEGYHLDVDPTFTATLDSDGNTFPILTDVVTNLGDTLTDVARQLAETAIDIRVNHDMTFDVWVKGTHGVDSGVTYEAGVNITELSFLGDTSPVSSLFVICSEGTFTVGDNSAGRQKRLDLSQLSLVEATARATDALADLSAARWKATLQVEPAGGDVPFDDLDILDTATVPDPDATPTPDVECVAISYSEGESNGREILIPEFGALVLTAEQRWQRNLSRLSEGGLGGSRLAMPGRALGGSPGSSPSLLGPAGGSFGQTAATREIDFTRTSTDTAPTSLAKMVGAGSTISEFAVVFDAGQGGDVDVVLEVNGSAVATITVPAGNTVWPASGVGFGLSKYTDLLTVTCTDVGFGFVATVLVS